MMYFLDFDRTLFDTEAFIASMQSRLEAGDLSFAPGELALFIYPDVPEFLRALGNEAVIVTHGNPVLQRMKVESALTGIPRVSVIYVDQEPKGPRVARRLAGSGVPALFSDDTPLELASVETCCPNIRLFEMRRDGGVGDGRWPVVRSLFDLPG